MIRFHKKRIVWNNRMAICNSCCRGIENISYWSRRKGNTCATCTARLVILGEATYDGGGDIELLQKLIEARADRGIITNYVRT